jgi:tRNA(Arg) A34 adenosine deaminase TadA
MMQTVLINDLKYMRKAIKLSIQNIDNGGGPFAAVIVKGSKIISVGVNRVTKNNDPTAHAEVNAIRSACRKLKTFDLSDCIIYTSCEPCPMCLGAIYWSRIKMIYYANTKEDAKAIGFDDSFIYSELDKSIDNRKISTTQILHDEAIVSFQKWNNTDNKIKY